MSAQVCGCNASRREDHNKPMVGVTRESGAARGREGVGCGRIRAVALHSHRLVGGFELLLCSFVPDRYLMI